jgi:hypothetical protein
MSRIITYSLRNSATDSDIYYKEITSFAVNWINKTLPDVADLVDGFREARVQQYLPDRQAASYAFELLVLGVLLQEQGSESMRLSGIWESILIGLLKVQERWPKSEGLVKAMRGLLYWFTRVFRRKSESIEYRIDALIRWIEVTGEGTLANRVKEWENFLRTKNIEEKTVGRVLRLADEFTKSSLAVLGKYTQRLDEFLVNEAPRHQLRYDAPLLHHTRVEYHLGMLGSEILNRAYRQAFLESPRKIVILPPCMRAQPEEKCKAVMTKYGEYCSSCTPSCRIHQVTKLGEKLGFEVFIIPDELRVFGDSEGKGGLGVVGVSCVLTNWTGGWDMDRLGIPAQGVLLDYVGCKYHWDEQGFPTDININQLIKCLGMD